MTPVPSGDIDLLKRLRRRGEDKFLGSLESQVMDRVWSRGRVTVRDVVAELSGKRQLAYTTVMTIMTRLHAKGLLRREREGKTYVYTPALTREEFRTRLSRDIVRGLVAEFGDVALAQFVAALDRVDEQHLRSLQRLASMRDEEKP